MEGDGVPNAWWEGMDVGPLEGSAQCLSTESSRAVGNLSQEVFLSVRPCSDQLRYICQASVGHIQQMT